MQDNKLIAEFMGYHYVAETKITHDYFIVKGRYIRPNGIKFDTDWNWLMDVVDKIESLGATTRVKSNYNQFIKANVHQVTIEIEKGELSEGNKVFWGDGFIYQNHSNSNVRKIEAYYESVVNFIKWYEQNNN